MGKKTIVLVALFAFCNVAHADLIDECRELLRREQLAGPINANTPQLNERAQAMATRVSTIFTNAISNIFWPLQAGTSDARVKWRDLTIKAIELSTYLKVVTAANAPHKPLSPDSIQLVVGLMRQTETCLTDFCNQPEILKARDEIQCRTPFCQVSQVAIERLTVPEEAQQLRMAELARAISAWASGHLLTPETLTRIILAFRMPDEKGSALDPAIRARIAGAHRLECGELGQSILRCIDQLSSKSFTGWRWMAGKVATNGLKLFDTTIGAFLLAIIEDDDSLALPIAERLLQTFAENSDSKSSEELKAELERAIDEDLSAFVKQLIHENPREKKTIKEMAETTIKQIRPMLVDIIWNKDARVAEQLVFHYLPIVLLKPAQSLGRLNIDADAHASGVAREFGRLSAQVASNYLWRADEANEGLRSLFIDSVRATTEQVSFLLLKQESTSDPTENAMRSARTLTMLHLFLDDYQSGVFRAHSLIDRNRDLNQPLIDLVFEVLRQKYPNDLGLKDRFETLMRDGSDTFFTTILDPVTICNLIIQFDFPKPGAPLRHTSGHPSLNQPDSSVHKPFGKAVVRTLRSFLGLGGELDVLDKSAIGIANKYHEAIGRKILTGDSTDYVPVLRQLFFKQGTENAGKPRLHVNWIDDEAKLKEALQAWLSQKLMPFIKGQVEPYTVWGTQWYVNSKIDAMIPALAAQVQNILWSKNQWALKVLLFHYLLPVWHDDVLNSAIESK